MEDQKNSGFSAEKFLSSYPDASSPTSVAPKKAKESPAKTVPDPPPKKEKVIPPKTPELILSDSMDSDLTDAERMYLNTFVQERVPTRFSKIGKQVALSPENHRKVMRIISIFGNGTTIGGYIDNVVRKHFEELTPLIQGLLDKKNKL